MQLTLLGVFAGCAAGGGPRPGDLPALSAAAQAQRFDTVQDALEHNPSGQPILWGAAGTVRGSVAPLATIPSTLYGWCRDYEERITAPGRTYRLVGIACRDKSGRWLVLDTRPFLEAQG